MEHYMNANRNYLQVMQQTNSLDLTITNPSWFNNSEIPINPAEIRRRRRTRTNLTSYQVKVLEQEYNIHKFLERRKQAISEKINIPEYTVKVWFQNRRLRERGKTGSLKGPDGRYFCTAKEKRIMLARESDATKRAQLLKQQELAAAESGIKMLTFQNNLTFIDESRKYGNVQKKWEQNMPSLEDKENIKNTFNVTTAAETGIFSKTFQTSSFDPLDLSKNLAKLQAEWSVPSNPSLNTNYPLIGKPPTTFNNSFVNSEGKKLTLESVAGANFYPPYNYNKVQEPQFKETYFYNQPINSIHPFKHKDAMDQFYNSSQAARQNFVIPSSNYLSISLNKGGKIMAPYMVSDFNIFPSTPTWV